jgi:hypothetical protein
VNLFGGQILSKIGSSDDDNVSDNEAIRHIATRQVIALSMGIPACLCAILALRLVGTKRLQVSFDAPFIYYVVCGVGTGCSVLCCTVSPVSLLCPMTHLFTYTVRCESACCSVLWGR